MIKKLYVHSDQDVPDDWNSKTVVLWEEDDTPVPDKEKTSAAFQRITGINMAREYPLHKIDQGDQLVSFYRGGWVRAVNCEGGWVGVLIDRSAKGRTS